MMRVDFAEFLKSKEPIVADGGMATALYDKGFYINRSFEELSLTEAQAVREVTQAFKQAGAQILSTNTYSAIHPKLAETGLQDQLPEMLTQSVEIARDVAGTDGYVLGVIGPLGLILEPLGPTSFAEAIEFFAKNTKVFDSADVDAIALKSFHDLGELRAALTAWKKTSEKPMLVNIAIQENMRTSYGHTLEEFVKLAESFGVSALGIAGEVGPSGALTATEILRKLTELPISILPNAGWPKYVNDEYIYLCNPDYMGKYAKRLVQAGANIVGGHSGVHDTHIKAIKNAVRMAQSITSEAGWTASTHIRPIVDKPKAAKPLGERSKLGHKLTMGEKIVTVEVIPPKGVKDPAFAKHCEALVAAGVEFINIPDGARAVARMGSLPLATFVKSNFNLEPIPHFTPRDRNLLGLQADLLGSHVNGVRNILLVTGDPPKLGNCPGASAVYDVDSIGLTHIVQRMNQGLDLGGSTFGEPSEFVFGVAVNPTSRNRDLEIKRFKYKIEAGANFAITQPIYDLEAYQQFMQELGSVPIPIIMGIWPLVSLRNAEFLKYEVPGVEVPDAVIQEMEKAGDSKEDAIRRGLEIAVKTMQAAEKFVAGFQVSAPFNRVDVAVTAIGSAMPGIIGSPQKKKPS